jgi:hypothetical protein
VEVRFKNTRKAFYRNATALQLMPGDLVTVDAAPGHDVGMVSLAGELVRAQMQRKKVSGDTYELRKVLRKIHPGGHRPLARGPQAGGRDHARQPRAMVREKPSWT